MDSEIHFAETAMPSIQIESRLIDDIPALTFALSNAESCPLVFFIHGFTSRKEEGLAIGYRLAEAGLFCVSVDAYLHGDRLGEPLTDLGSPERATIYPPGTGFDTYFVMLDCAMHTAADLDRLIDHFARDPRVNAARVGVTGFSMGGFASYFAAANNPRITTAVPMGAYPDLARRWHDLVLEASAYEEWTAEMDRLQDENERRAAWLRQINPAAKLLRDYRKPLFMANGDLDTDSPKAYVVPFFGEMRPLYAEQPERLKLKIYDGLAHTLDGQMIEDAVNWFCRYLSHE